MIGWVCVCDLGLGGGSVEAYYHTGLLVLAESQMHCALIQYPKCLSAEAAAVCVCVSVSCTVLMLCSFS